MDKKDVLHRIIFGALFLSILTGSPGCLAQNDHRADAQSITPTFNVQQIKNDMVTLDLTAKCVPTVSISRYLDYYGMAFKAKSHNFGYFTSQSYRISAHIIMPQNPKGTLFLLHGYLDHTAYLKHLIHAAIARDFGVAAFDLPGHGLSTGDRVAINDFGEYVTVLSDFLTQFADGLPKPYYLIGHSTGSAIAFEYMQTECHTFDKIVFLAPLVRNANWHLSKFGTFIAKLFVDTIPRKNRKNSSDKQFLEFVKKDPLQCKRLSIEFLGAFHKWEKRVQYYKPIPDSVLLIQGTQDDIVDWRYNISFLKTKVKRIKVELVDDARHQLMNESDALRTKVFDMIFEYVEG